VPARFEVGAISLEKPEAMMWPTAAVILQRFRSMDRRVEIRQIVARNAAFSLFANWLIFNMFSG
jgi:hypothetical protein